MAPDYVPRISAENCHYPFTYLGVLYHGCAENIENVTAPCERWGCFQVNYSAAVCAANIGKCPVSVKQEFSAIADKPHDANVQYAVALLTLRHWLPVSIRYHAEVGISTSKRMDVSRRVPPKLGRAAGPPFGTESMPDQLNVRLSHVRSSRACSFRCESACCSDCRLHILSTVSCLAYRRLWEVLL